MKGFDAFTYNRSKCNLKFWDSIQFTNEKDDYISGYVFEFRIDPNWEHSKIAAWPDAGLLDRIQIEAIEEERLLKESDAFREWFKDHIKSSVKDLKIGKELVFPKNREFVGFSMRNWIKKTVIQFGFNLKFTLNKDGSVTVKRCFNDRIEVKRESLKHLDSVLMCWCDNCVAGRRLKETVFNEPLKSEEVGV